MSKLRRQVSTHIANVAETKNLTDLKNKTGNLYESIAIIAKRANQINITMKEELHSKLEEFATAVGVGRDRVKLVIDPQELKRLYGIYGDELLDPGGGVV